MTSTTASAIRPGLRDNRQLSGSPHTPSRFISSNFSSPGAGLRQEEDAIIFDLSSRRLCAGFEGESGPQCALSFGPDQWRRVGDWRIWLPDHKRLDTDLEDAIKAYELWRNDLSDVDLALVEDRVERVVREVYNKHLLTDAGTARLILVLPSVVPLPVVSSILMTLFERWRYPSITLLPAPTMSAVAAGVRSALVIDIGWEETIATPISEYRELGAYRSTRAMKRLTLALGGKLHSLASRYDSVDGESLRLDFDFVEDFVKRIAQCQISKSNEADSITDNIQNLSVTGTVQTIPIQWPTRTSSREIAVSPSEISALVNDCFLGQELEIHHDDHEDTLAQLLFRSLLNLTPDTRGICMSRIIFTGPGAAIPGLKENTLNSVDALIRRHGWSAVRGQHVQPSRRGLSEIGQGRVAPPDAKHNVSRPGEKDFVEEKLHKQRLKDVQTSLQGQLRSVDSLGPWVGASLVTSLKVKSVVEIDRERFLSHGISGATRDLEASVVPQRIGSQGLTGSKGSDRSSWTLGAWG